METLPLFCSFLKFYESGVQSRMQKMINDPRLKQVEEIAFHPVEMKHILDILKIPFFAVFLSVFIILGEYVFLKFRF